jgi:GAF domain-containing protein
MVKINCLEPLALERFLERRRATMTFPLEMSLAENLVEVLRRANEFVPSEAGSILLDNPSEKLHDRDKNTLTFIAAFGEKSNDLVAQKVPADMGIGGRVYITGESYCTGNARGDELFNPTFDDVTDYQTKSLVAIPVRIEHEVCGVLELVNRLGAEQYSQQDLNLLEIFAGYISVSIQNVLDGRQAQEIAKRDNLTGLYNDRYLHIALSQAISKSRKEDLDFALIFLDLDFFKQQVQRVHRRQVWRRRVCHCGPVGPGRRHRSVRGDPQRHRRLDIRAETRRYSGRCPVLDGYHLFGRCRVAQAPRAGRRLGRAL